jgi:hypothetical protein
VGLIKPTYRAANAATATEDEPTPNLSFVWTIWTNMDDID